MAVMLTISVFSYQFLKHIMKCIIHNYISYYLTFVIIIRFYSGFSFMDRTTKIPN